MLADFTTAGLAERPTVAHSKPPAVENSQIFPVSADRGEICGFHELRTYVFVGRRKAPEVVNWIFTEDHLAQMILPHIGFDRAPRKGFSIDGDHLALSVHAGIGGSGHNKVHLRSPFPKSAGKIMRENQ